MKTCVSYTSTKKYNVTNGVGGGCLTVLILSLPSFLPQARNVRTLMLTFGMCSSVFELHICLQTHTDTHTHPLPAYRPTYLFFLDTLTHTLFGLNCALPRIQC